MEIAENMSGLNEPFQYLFNIIQEPETKVVVAAKKPASGGDKMKRIGPVAAAVIAGEPPKKINK